MNALKVFEAAARHTSFKEAARELQVTPSAISHGVRTLEEWVGRPLFTRANQALALTKAGTVYSQAATEALKCLSDGSETRPGAAPNGRLAISAAPTFAARILLPRLSRLRQTMPELSVQVDTSHRLVEFPHEVFDAAVRLGTGDWPGLEATLLLTESLVPVCSPTQLASLGSPIDFHQERLIHLTSVSQDWTAWLAATKQSPADLNRGFMADSIHLAVAAAIQGLGIAIGRRPLIDAELAAGTLVECGSAVRSRTSYYFVVPRSGARRPEVSRFREWLLHETSEFRAPVALEVLRRAHDDAGELPP